MKCDYCKKGRPKLWNKDGKFCDEKCYQLWKEEQTIKTCDVCGKPIKKGKELRPYYVPKVPPIPDEGIKRLDAVVCSEKCSRMFLDKLKEWDIIAEMARK